ncbi:MAG TPA: YihY/virulence factor BrkB family protein, partial [Chitinophagaceae bacterium]|nr:YihY/virulence factor BrkB family protein [Chitinophagaceae bacterium]
LKKSFAGFISDKVPKLSGSLSYYMIFSMGPLLLIIITLCSMFLGREAIEGGIYRQLEDFTGPDTAIQLQQIIKNASLSGKTNIATIIGVITLLIGATSVFAEMQDSINMIWGVKAKPKKNWLKFIQDRFMSFSIIISLSFLLLVSLGISALIESFGNYLTGRFPDVAVIVFYILNQLIIIAITCFIFGIVFRVLPDAEIRWKDVIAGSVVTTILFLLGKFAISFYISKTAVGSTYGPAGALIILIVWIYYSSIILYFGAEFTKFYALQYGAPIHPSKYAVTVEQVEKETGKISIQQNEQEKELAKDK